MFPNDVGVAIARRVIGGRVISQSVRCRLTRWWSSSARQGRSLMMYGMNGMGWGMGLISLLALVLLVLGIAALVRYLSGPQ
jgi:hypothetical protein